MSGAAPCCSSAGPRPAAGCRPQAARCRVGCGGTPRPSFRAAALRGYAGRVVIRVLGGSWEQLADCLHHAAPHCAAGGHQHAGSLHDAPLHQVPVPWVRHGGGSAARRERWTRGLDRRTPLGRMCNARACSACAHTVCARARMCAEGGWGQAAEAGACGGQLSARHHVASLQLDVVCGGQLAACVMRRHACPAHAVPCQATVNVWSL